MDTSEYRFLLDRRRRGLEAFARWDATFPAPSRSDASVLADLGALHALLPPEVRAEDPDPDRVGVRRMHRLLAVLRSRQAA